MDRKKLDEMGTFEMYNLEWRDSRNNRVYHLTTVVRIDDPAQKRLKALRATGEDIKTGREKGFELADFIAYLEPAKT